MNIRSSRILLLTVVLLVGAGAAVTGSAAAYEPVPQPDKADIVSDPAGTEISDANHTVSFKADPGGSLDNNLGAVNISYDSSSDIELTTGDIDAASVDVYVNGTEVPESDYVVDANDNSKFINVSDDDSDGSLDGINQSGTAGVTGAVITVEVTKGITNPTSEQTSVDVTVTDTDGTDSFEGEVTDSTTLNLDGEAAGAISLSGTTAPYSTLGNAIEDANDNGENVQVLDDINVTPFSNLAPPTIDSDIAIAGQDNPNVTIVNAPDDAGSSVIKNQFLSVGDTGDNGGVLITGLTVDDQENIGSIVTTTDSTDNIEISANTFKNFDEGSSDGIAAGAIGQSPVIKSNEFDSNSLDSVIALGTGGTGIDAINGSAEIADNVIVNSGSGSDPIIEFNATFANSVSVANNSITLDTSDTAIDVTGSEDLSDGTTIDITASGAEIGGNSGAVGVSYSTTAGSQETVTIDGLKFNNDIDNAIDIDGGADDLTINDINVTQATPSQAAIELSSDDVSSLTVTNVEFNNLQSADDRGLRLQSLAGLTSPPTIDGIDADNSNEDGEIVVVDTPGFSEDLTIQNLNVDGAKQVVNVVDADIGNQQDLVLTGIDAVNMSGADAIDIKSTNSRYVEISDVTLESIDDKGIDVNDPGLDLSSELVIQNVDIDGINDATGIHVREGSALERLSLTNAAVNDTGTSPGIDIGADADYETVDLTNVESTNNSNQGILIHDGSMLTISGQATLNDITVDDNGGTGLDIDNVNADISIDGLSADSSSGQGVHLDASGSADYGTVDVTNIVANDTGVGLDADADGFASGDSITVTNSAFTNNSGQGVNIDASAGSVTLNQNTFEDNSGNIVVHDGTGTADLSSNYWGAETGPQVDDGSNVFLGNGDSLDLTGLDGGNFDLQSDSNVWLPFLDQNGEPVFAFAGKVKDPNEVDLENEDVTFDIDGESFTYEGTGSSSESGQYVAVAGGNGTFDVSATAAGFAPSNTSQVAISSSEYVSFGEDFTLQEGGTIEGSITAPSGDAEEFTNNFQLINDETGETAAQFDSGLNGDYSSGIAPGTYDLRVTQSNLPNSSVVEDVEITAGETTSDVDFTMGGQLNGTVFTPDGTVFNSTGSDINITDTATGETVEFGSEVSTNDDGEYGKVAIEAGTYDLEVVNSSFSPSATETVTINDGEVTTQNFTLTELSTADLTATIQDSNDEAVTDTEVTLTASDSAPGTLDVTKTTDSNGQFTVKIPASDPPAAYDITASAEGFTDATVGFAPTPGETPSRTFSLSEEEQEQLPDRSITFDDKTVGNTSTDITVESATFNGSQSFNVVVHEATRNDDGTVNIGQKIGESVELDNGTQTDITVNISKQVQVPDDNVSQLTEDQVLVAMLHTTNTSDDDDIVHTAPIREDGTENTPPVFDDANITVSPLEGTTGDFDSDGDGELSVNDVGDAASAFIDGDLSIQDISRIAAEFIN